MDVMFMRIQEGYLCSLNWWNEKINPAIPRLSWTIWELRYDNNENNIEIGSSCNNKEDVNSLYHRSHHDVIDNFSS